MLTGNTLQCNHCVTGLAENAATWKEKQMFKITFYVYSEILCKEFFNVETHRSLADANLRALALGWTIHKVEEI